MSSLHDLQAAFRASILRGKDAPLVPYVMGSGLQPEQRLQIYRNNTFISLRAALEATFPVVRRLVGDGFFAAAARSFIREHPPTRPCLSEYGGAFPNFLAGYAPARPLSYLPDVARLEWALNEAYFAPDAEALRPETLAAIPAAEYPALRFTLHPSVRLVESRFPIDRVWQANQPDSDGEQLIDLAEGGCRLLVGRAGGDAVFQRISAAEAGVVTALGEGRTLAAAYEAATGHDPAFVPTAILHRLLSAGFLTGFAIAGAHAGS